MPGPQLRLPTLIPIKNIQHISCGNTHVGIVTTDGKCYTWGSGDNGMLGHGTKTAVSSPKMITSLSSKTVLSISCGAYHTAIIACNHDDITYVKVPSSNNNSINSNNNGTAADRFRERQDNEDILACGDLYTFGLNKAGQLGLNTSNGSVSSPTLVNSLQSEGFKIARVSCGFHHTLIVGIPIHAIRVFITTLFSCGWGEYGRLGLGDEEQRNVPTAIIFPLPFHPIDISAGEQHSLAIGKDSCYSWGSNSMGQLGVGSPNTLDMSVLPIKIPIPEGMVIKKIAAGGRHSAAITKCGKLLTWGWGEEGQLGHGTEKNSFLPRPCRLPRIKGKIGQPVSVSLGQCHTFVIVNNESYEHHQPPTQLPTKKEESPIKQIIDDPIVPIIEPSPEKIQEEDEPVLKEEVVVDEPAIIPEPIEEEYVEAASVEEIIPVSPMKVVHDVFDVEKSIVNLKGLLQLSEDRKKEEEIVDEVVNEVVNEVVEEPKPEVIIPQEEPPEIEQQWLEKLESDIESDIDDDNINNTTTNTTTVEDKYKIYYKDGMNYDNCLIANSAKRAELRRKKKEGKSSLSLKFIINIIITIISIRKTKSRWC